MSRVQISSSSWRLASDPDRSNHCLRRRHIIRRLSSLTETPSGSAYSSTSCVPVIWCWRAACLLKGSVKRLISSNSALRSDPSPGFRVLRPCRALAGFRRLTARSVILQVEAADSLLAKEEGAALLHVAVDPRRGKLARLDAPGEPPPTNPHGWTNSRFLPKVDFSPRSGTSQVVDASFGGVCSGRSDM